MVEAAKIPNNPPALKNSMRFLVVGKLTEVNYNNGVYYHRLMTPAVDEYSQPQRLEIRCDRKLGQVNEEITTHVTLGGYFGRKYQITDRETGERRDIQPVNHVLTAE